MTTKKNITQFAAEISEHWEATRARLNKKDCREIAKTFVEHIWYVDNVLKNFPDASLEIDNNSLCVKYSKGEGHINIEHLQLDVFIPEVQKVCEKYGKKLYAPIQLQAA